MEKRTDVLRALRAGWWLAPVVLVASLAGAWYFESTEDERPVYRAVATVAAVPHPSVNNNIHVLRAVEVLERRSMVATLSRIPTSGNIRRAAAKRLETPVREFRAYRIRTSILPNTHLIRLSVQGPDPERAADLANAVAAISEQEATGYYRVFALRVLDRANVPGRSITRESRRAFVVAGILGLLVGLVAAYGYGVLRLRAGGARSPEAPGSRS